MGNQKPSSSAWLTSAQSWKKVFDIIILIISSTPFLKVGHGVKDSTSIHNNVAHLSSSMKELLTSCWISTSFVWSLLISCQSENLRAQKLASHIAKSPPWSSGLGFRANRKLVSILFCRTSNIHNPFFFLFTNISSQCVLMSHWWPHLLLFLYGQKECLQGI